MLKGNLVFCTFEPSLKQIGINGCPNIREPISMLVRDSCSPRRLIYNLGPEWGNIWNKMGLFFIQILLTIEFASKVGRLKRFLKLTHK